MADAAHRLLRAFGCQRGVRPASGQLVIVDLLLFGGADAVFRGLEHAVLVLCLGCGYGKWKARRKEDAHGPSVNRLTVLRG